MNYCTHATKFPVLRFTPLGGVLIGLLPLKGSLAVASILCSDRQHKFAGPEQKFSTAREENGSAMERSVQPIFENAAPITKGFLFGPISLQPD